MKMGKADLHMDNECHVWQRQDLAKLFLDDVRGGIPLAAEQIDVLLRVVRHAILELSDFSTWVAAMAFSVGR